MRTGNYKTQLKGELNYKAFIPSYLPYELQRDPELDVLLSEANLALGRLDGISEIVPDIDFLTLMFGRKEATFSSQVEGTQATFADVLKVEAKIKDKSIPLDVKEIINYIEAMNYGVKRLTELPLSLRLIKEIHKILLTGVRGEEKQPGEFRITQNWLGGPTIQTATYVPPPATELDGLLDNFEKFLYDKSPLPALIRIGLIHSQFENIHPFLDGNGRVGRLLITFYLWHQRVLKKPLLYLSAYFKKRQKDYYYFLQRVHEEDDIEDWLKFFLQGIIETAREALKTAQKILWLKEKDTRRIMALGRVSQNASLVLNQLFKNPFITLPNIISLTGLSRSNGHHLLKRLAKMGLIHPIGRESGRVKIYVYQNYLDLFKYK